MSVLSSYNASVKYKLVVGLHGCSGTLSAFSFRNQLQFLSDSIGAIILCPQGLTGNNGFMGGNDTVFVRMAIDSVLNDYNIDTGQVYLIGFSCNGYTAANMGTLKKFQFRGIIPFNAGFLTSDFVDNSFDFGNKVPTCLCVGSLDPGLGINQRYRDSLISNSVPHLFNLIQGIGHTTSFPGFNEEIMKCFRFFNHDSTGTGVTTNLTSIDEFPKSSYEKKSITISLFPNPTIEKLFFSINAAEPISCGLLKIFNSCGKEIMVLPTSGATHFFINLELLVPGFYIWYFSSQNGFANGKILKEQ